MNIYFIKTLVLRVFSPSRDDVLINTDPSSFAVPNTIISAHSISSFFIKTKSPTEISFQLVSYS